MNDIQVRAFNKEVDGSTMRSIIALAGGQPVGSLDINDWHKPGGWITWVNVTECFRRQGIARRMFERALADAREAGKVGIGLSVKPENTVAQALYESLGFRVTYTYDSGLLAMTIHL
jgi:ribosomal protein S18 acetylase RimI-like enzyme